MRIIFHLDMDHFYTAVEEREHPEIKGKPVIVGSDPKEGKGRGVVSTSNYEARKVRRAFGHADFSSLATLSTGGLFAAEFSIVH